MKNSGSKHLMNLFFENVPVSLQSLDEEGNFIEVNPHWCKVLGYSREEVIGRNFGNFLIEDHKELFHKNFAAFKKSGLACDVAFKMIRKDGTVIQVSYDGNIYIDPITGKFQTFCVFKDLTQSIHDHEIAQKALLESEKRLTELQENIVIGIFRVDPQGKLLYTNPALQKILGIKDPEKAKGISSLSFYLNPDQREEILEELRKTPDKRVSQDVLFKRVDGTPFWARINIKGVYNQQGELLHRDGTIEDISQIKKSEEELINARNQAVHADRLKSTFLANMSHEIRTPMNAILGFSELLLDPDIPHDQKSDFSTLINNNGNILMNLIDDIIDISKIEAGETQITLTNCPIFPILLDLQLQFDEKMSRQKKQLDLRLIVASELKTLAIRTDGFRIRQVLTNLLDNALKFTSVGEIAFGMEVLTSEDRKEQLCIFVQDTGIGIPAQMQQIIFDQFRQVDESPTRKYGGTGLGLYICKKLVSLLGGTIHVSSEPDKGARFEVLLPLKI